MDPDNHSKYTQVLGTLGVIGIFCFGTFYCNRVNNPEWQPSKLYTQEEANAAWQKELQESQKNSKPRLESYTETYNRILREKELERLEPYIQAQVEMQSNIQQMQQNEIDLFQDMLDDFYDDMEDEIRFPSEVFDANRD